MVDTEARAEIRGIPASGGGYRGRARVVRSADDLAQVVVGDVIVAPTARPEYAAGLRLAGALLVGGGMLSSLVTVARELGIPAVVAPSEAFCTVITGDELLVDGDLGVVQRLPNAAPSS